MSRFLLFIIILVGVTEKTIAQNPDTIIIENVNVITMVSEEILPNQRVIISDGKIIKIESSLLPLHDSQLEKIDGKNKYSIPGLSEMLAEGKNANLVLLNKNPLDDINNTKSIEGVILKGKWLDKAALDKLLKEVETAYKYILQ